MTHKEVDWKKRKEWTGPKILTTQYSRNGYSFDLGTFCWLGVCVVLNNRELVRGWDVYLLVMDYHKGQSIPQEPYNFGFLKTSDSCPADGIAGGWNQQAVHRSQRILGVEYNNKTDMGGEYGSIPHLLSVEPKSPTGLWASFNQAVRHSPELACYHASKTRRCVS